MNYWTKLSVEFANQKNCLDELYKVYPIVPNLKRKLPNEIWNNIENFYKNKNDIKLIRELLKFNLFPIKDSFVSYLRKDLSAIERNPNTISKIAGNLYSLEISDIYEKCVLSKEANRQIGPMFKNWIDNKTLGVKIIKDENEFLNYKENSNLNISDDRMLKFAFSNFGYIKNKGIDFIAKFNNKYVVAETKFLTDFGGHQYAQFEDAISTIERGFDFKKTKNVIIVIAILDGVLYIQQNNKMYNYLIKNDDKIILSSCVLREFLFSI